MKISKITIQKFRSIQHTALEPRDYTVLIGPNNHGKSNILRALLFFFDEIKLTEEDFLQEEHGIQESEMWVEVEYSNLSSGEAGDLPPEYLLDGKRLRVRRVASLKDLKHVAHGYEKKNGEEVLSENDFFGAKGVGKAKLGDVVFIPAIRDVKDELKPQGSTALASLVKQIITPALGESPEYRSLVAATEAFEKAIRGEASVPSRDKRTYSNLAEIEHTLVEELQDQQYTVKVQLLPIEPSEIVKQGASFSLKRPNEPEGPPESKGHGVQRLLLLGLLRILAEAERMSRLRSASTQKKVFRPSFTLVLFEEPEIFQHPPRQSHLFKDLRLLSKRPEIQVIVSSHSNLFLDPESDLESITVVRKMPATQIFRVSTETKMLLEEAAKKNLFNLITWLNADRNCMFFCDLVLLVEGSTEKVTIPYLAAKYDGQLDGVYVLDCGLKTNIKYFMMICSDLAIPHLVLHDSDENKATDDPVRKENEVITAHRNSFTRSINIVSPKFEDYFGIPPSEGRKKPLEALQFFQTTDIVRDKLEKILPDLFPVRT